MNIKELIDAATNRSAKTQAEIAEELGISPARVSEWKSGKRKPDAGEIAFFAERAGLSVFETVAEIETQLRPAYAQIWKRAVSQGMAKSLFHHFFSSGPSTGRFWPHFGWCGSRA